MTFDKLYKALVIGGAALTLGACGGATSTSAAKPAKAKPAKPELASCETICSGEGREMFCPMPKGGNNCCWLMSPPHRCCPKPGL
jgi:hypothetical protein